MRFTKPYKALALLMAVSLCVSGCGLNKQGSNEETPKPSPVADKDSLNETEDADSNLGFWARAMGSILMSMNEGSVYYFGGYEKNEYNMDAAKTILEQTWSIKTRKDLIRQIRKLVKGQSRKKYLADAKEVNSYTAKQLESILKELPEENRLYYSLVQYNWEKWQKRGMMAWDLCRVSHLAQWGYIAGYFTLEEAQAIIEPAAKKLQKKFTSWEEVQMNWLDGYALWAEVDIEAEDSEYQNRKAVYEELVSAQEKEGLLYDDSLFTSEIKPVEGVSYHDLFQEVKKNKGSAATGAAVATGAAADEEGNAE